MLADVDAGSDTPSLVGKVLKWRKEKSIEGKSDFKCLWSSSYNSPLLLADALWKHLDQLNQSLAQTLLHLSKLHDQDPENYKNAVKYISSLQSVQASLPTFSSGKWLTRLPLKVGCESLPACRRITRHKGLL
jgi:phosphomevalonate kinase